MKSIDSKPSILLWFMCRLTFVVLPLAVLLVLSFDYMGMSVSVLTVIVGIVISHFLIGQYENIHIELMDYLRKEKNKVH